MTKEEILAILDNNAAENRGSMKWAAVAGGLMLIGSAALFIFAEEPGLWAYVLGFAGVASIVGAITRLRTNAYEKQAQKIKDVFYVNPSDLVWSYTLVIKGNMSNVKQVIMKFRDGTEFTISEDAIPSKNCNELVESLTVINPKMIVGYSEETEKLYKAKQL